jgi:hypothetical protein
MHLHTIGSGYRQFYVSDAGLDPDAPEDWTDDHVAQRHNTLHHITALCPEGDITARLFIVGPGDESPEIEDTAEFEVVTRIEIQSGRLAISEWPRDMIREFWVSPGAYEIIFKGYRLKEVDSEKDYYGVFIKRKKA